MWKCINLVFYKRLILLINQLLFIFTQLSSVVIGKHFSVFCPSQNWTMQTSRFPLYLQSRLSNVHWSAHISLSLSHGIETIQDIDLIHLNLKMAKLT